MLLIRNKTKKSIFSAIVISFSIIITGVAGVYATGRRLLPSGVNVTHTETTPYNWYFTPNNTGTAPLLDANLKFTENYSSFYYDKSADENDKVIYLTFDAGYENGNVEKILDTLDSHGAKGAFLFLTI